MKYEPFVGESPGSPRLSGSNVRLTFGLCTRVPAGKATRWANLARVRVRPLVALGRKQLLARFTRRIHLLMYTRTRT